MDLSGSSNGYIRSSFRPNSWRKSFTWQVASLIWSKSHWAKQGFVEAVAKWTALDYCDCVIQSENRELLNSKEPGSMTILSTFYKHNIVFGLCWSLLASFLKIWSTRFWTLGGLRARVCVSIEGATNGYFSTEMTYISTFHTYDIDSNQIARHGIFQFYHF